MSAAAARSLRLAIAVGAIASFPQFAAPAAGQSDPPPLPRDWNQRCANAANSSACDVEPVRAPPTEAWRLHFDAVLSAPVVASDRLFVVVREAKERRLVALEPASGRVVAKRSIDKGGDVVSLAADGSSVVEVEPDKARLLHLAGDKFAFDRALDGAFVGDPVVLDGLLLLHHWDPKSDKDRSGKNGKSERVVKDKESAGLEAAQRSANFDVLEFASGKLLGSFALGNGRPAFLRGPNGAWTAIALSFDSEGAPRFRDHELQLRPQCSADRGTANGRAWQMGPLDAADMTFDSAVVVECVDGFDRHARAWLATPAVPDEKMHLAAPPVLFEKRLVGFATNGHLLSIDVVGETYRDLLSGAFPKGAVRGAASRARDVLYLGNWAVELGSGRVLWCVEGLEPVGPAIPAGDGVLVVVTKTGDVVGLVDPKLAADHAASAASATTGPKERPRLPSEDAELAKRLGGDERAAFLACCEALSAEQLDLLVAQFEKYATFKFFDECQRLLDAAKRCGLDRTRSDELARRIAGQASSTSGNAPQQRRKLASDEHAELEKLVARTIAAADWCAQQKLVYAATGLVKRAGSILADRPVDPAHSAPWMPASFPWKDGNATLRWVEWADALLPSGATFVARDDAVWQRVKGSAFEKDAIALRSANLLLFTREETPSVVGPCLLRGEAAVRALDGLLGPSPTGLKRDAPLEVRLHATRQQYLDDRIGGQAPPMPWSAGVYSNADHVSRFYAENAGDRGDPLGRELHSVLAHELTHHYVDQRWIVESGAPTLPGMWLVEGVAEFVSEQAVEMGRLGAALDDATVSSLDATAAMAAKGKLIPVATLMLLDRTGFETKLESKESDLVQLRHSLHAIHLDLRGLFYTESAALSFFALRRAGETGRKGYLELLQSFYRGKRVAEPWKSLGFADAAALEKAFGAFLAGL
jgi:hypothetical protein